MSTNIRLRFNNNIILINTCIKINAFINKHTSKNSEVRQFLSTSTHVQGDSEKTPQHKNRDISEICERLGENSWQVY